jgi:hypothetical protein
MMKEVDAISIEIIVIWHVGHPCIEQETRMHMHSYERGSLLHVCKCC